MHLKVISCEEPTVVSFCHNIKKEDHVIKHTSIEEARAKKSNSLVLGKIIKIISYSKEAERYIILVKEFLPSYSYGQKFKAVVQGELARELACFSPETGDRLGFPEPNIFLNPAYEPEKNVEIKKQPKYLLQSKHGEGGLMWFAKKQEMGGKSDDEKRVKQTRSPEKRLEQDAAATSKKVINDSLSRGSIASRDRKSQTQDVEVVQTSQNVRQKPLIQLPQKPQIPINTKRLNPQYNYKAISSIKTSDLSKSDQSVNFFGVVNDIIKPLSITKKNKYMLVCTLIDDSDDENGMIKFHFFTPEDTIIKQIEIGDVVRLHRVKLESFNNEIDGRVFFSQDIVIFKKDSPDMRPITIAKNTLITDEEKRRVETLKKWFSDNQRRPVLLSDICLNGKYNILCKVVSEPRREGNVVKVKVTDGSAIKNLVPSIPLQRYNLKREGRKDHIITEIIARNKLDDYANLKTDDFILFSDVEAISFGVNKYRLEINSDASPETLVGRNLQVADIECRIEQCKKSLDENIQSENSDGLDKNELENVVKVVEKNQNILLGSPDKESSIQTRQQKNKQKASPVKNVEKSISLPCDNKSCHKPNSVVFNIKDDGSGKNTESDPGTKSRKQLFTPNYMTDLSDAATDETSEHNFDGLKDACNKVPDEDLVNPANTDFSHVVEKVKTKFCTPKRQGQLIMSKDEEGFVRRSSSRKTRDGNRFPVVMLKKHPGIEAYNDPRQETNRKRVMNAPGSQDDIEDVETVLNFSFRDVTHGRPRHGNKRTRLESLSTEENNLGNNDAGVDHELDNRGQKVSSWLFHPNNKIAAQEDIANDEFDVAVVKQILCCDKVPLDMSKYISALSFRIQAFLLEIIPDPSLSPLDLVSGYCHSGCQRIFIFSTIKWFHEDNRSIPLCPECGVIEGEKELELMFMMELIIMDPAGKHGSVLVARNNAEQFLNCSAAEFVKDEVVRKSRVQLLTDYSMQNTYRAEATPLLDIGVSPLNSISPTLVLVNSTLKLPKF